MKNYSDDLVEEGEVPVSQTNVLLIPFQRIAIWRSRCQSY